MNDAVESLQPTIVCFISNLLKGYHGVVFALGEFYAHGAFIILICQHFFWKETEDAQLAS